jgi:hypothetical protein
MIITKSIRLIIYRRKKILKLNMVFLIILTGMNLYVTKDKNNIIMVNWGKDQVLI